MTGTDAQDPDELRKELVQHAHRKSAPSPHRTRSSLRPDCRKPVPGKIMRRILRKIAEDEVRRIGRHLNARRSGRGGRPDRKSPEQEMTTERPGDFPAFLL
ncbi:hypothetical protein VXQ18_06870 [Brucella abortus]|nr:hypothetical protein [Brucella abortus]